MGDLSVLILCIAGDGAVKAVLKISKHLRLRNVSTRKVESLPSVMYLVDNQIKSVKKKLNRRRVPSS